MGVENNSGGGAPAAAEIAPDAIEPAAAVAEPIASTLEGEAAPAPAPAAEEVLAVVEPEAVIEPAAPVEPAPPVEGEKPAEVAAEPQAPAAPVYEEFKIPEGLQVAPEQLTAFTSTIGKYGLTQEAGQELMNLHAQTLQQATEAMAQRQQDVFAETRRGFVQDFDKSAGNKRDTILNDAKWAITELIPDAKARRELWDVFAFTGAGDHKAVINAFASAAKRLREANPPPKALPQNPAKGGTAADRRYGKTPS